MADTMSYHYHAQSHSASVDHGSHPLHSHHLCADCTSPHAMAHAVMTHPDHGDHSGIGGLNGEKRRSKLGYHRTSVACGHCRRRKIRCIPSPNDPRGRCINCIRLKKDCSFYPVDQLPPPDARKNPRSSTMAPPIKSEPYSPDQISGKPPFDYGPGMTAWVSGASSGSSKAADMAALRYHESPATTSFSSYTAHTAHSPDSWTPHPDSASSRTGDEIWPYAPQPPRSLSFSSDTMSSGSHHASHAPPYPSIDQMTRGAHHSSGNSSIPGVDSIGPALDHHAPLSETAYPGWSSGAYPSEPYCAWSDASAPMYYTR